MGKLIIKTKEEIEEEEILLKFMPSQEEIDNAELEIKILTLILEVEE